MLLQKLLLLHPYCPRLWIRLGEIQMRRYFEEKSIESPVASKAKLDYCSHTANAISMTSSSAKDQNILCNGLSDITSTVSVDVSTDVDCTDCPVPLVDGPMPEFNIPSGIMHSLTCFVATV